MKKKEKPEWFSFDTRISNNEDFFINRFTFDFGSSLLVRTIARLICSLSDVLIADEVNCWNGVILNENFWRNSDRIGVGNGPKLYIS